MPVRNAPATLVPPQRGASCAQAHPRTARRLSADGNRRPATDRCSHHPGCTPAAVQIAAHNGAPLWRSMMERWLAAAS